MGEGPSGISDLVTSLARTSVTFRSREGLGLQDVEFQLLAMPAEGYNIPVVSPSV